MSHIELALKKWREAVDKVCAKVERDEPLTTNERDLLFTPATELMKMIADEKRAA